MGYSYSEGYYDALQKIHILVSDVLRYGTQQNAAKFCHIQLLFTVLSVYDMYQV
jgi:hypothetical protein